MIEADGCWMFFLDEQWTTNEIVTGGLNFTAYAIARTRGLASYVYDFRPDMEKVQRYAELWSLHALGKQDAAHDALQEFQKRYSTNDWLCRQEGGDPS